MSIIGSIWESYRFRLKRRRLLLRALRKRRQLTKVVNRTGNIQRSDIIAAATVRNEILRLPYFLDYYRKQGVNHFLLVDNNSSDGTKKYLENQPDVSLWSTNHSYKLSRFGVDWLTWLLIKYGHGHWCLTLDADEIFIYPYCDTRNLQELTAWLDQNQVQSFGALMMDMYPKGKLDAVAYWSGQNPFDHLRWFDADNITRTYQPKLQNYWIQGGIRARHFFADRPERAPTLNKTPLVKWNRRFVYVSSTHSLYPRRLNYVFETDLASGALLHSKFLHTISERSEEEQQRKEHFANSELYNDYYQGLMENPDLWHSSSVEYQGWQQLVDLGLMSTGKWE